MEQLLIQWLTLTALISFSYIWAAFIWNNNYKHSIKSCYARSEVSLQAYLALMESLLIFVQNHFFARWDNYLGVSNTALKPQRRLLSSFVQLAKIHTSATTALVSLPIFCLWRILPSTFLSYPFLFWPPSSFAVCSSSILEQLCQETESEGVDVTILALVLRTAIKDRLGLQSGKDKVLLPFCSLQKHTAI